MQITRAAILHVIYKSRKRKDGSSPIYCRATYQNKRKEFFIGAVSLEMKFAKTKFCEKLDGIIGSTLIKKAKWQIDYDKQVIRLSNDISNLITGKPEYTLNTNQPSKGWGAETIELNIDGYVSQFNFDTGNGREKIVLHPRKLEEITIKNKESVISYGFDKSNTDYKLIAETVTIGTLKFDDQAISLQNEVGNTQLLGNRFFELFLVTIDWDQHHVYLDPIKEILSDKLIGFELVLNWILKPTLKLAQ